MREDQIDLSNATIDTGEIYTRMVRCLYKKFIIRQKLEYQPASFTKAITAVGKIAYQTLLTGNPLLRRSDVMNEVGEDAFACGLLIGHEEAHKLIRDETADILVTFPHRSFQEFLGAFYFIQALDKGRNMSSLRIDNGEPLFMTNPLFLYFCIWLVQHAGKYFIFEKLENVLHAIQNYILESINKTCLNFFVISRKFPAMDIEKAIKNNDTAGLTVYGYILSKCHKVRTIKLESNDSLDWVLTSVSSFLPLIRNIIVKDCFDMSRIGNVFLTINKPPSKCLRRVSGNKCYRRIKWSILLCCWQKFP